jgi:hypothetical protein
MGERPLNPPVDGEKQERDQSKSKIKIKSKIGDRFSPTA